MSVRPASQFKTADGSALYIMPARFMESKISATYAYMQPLSTKSDIKSAEITHFCCIALKNDGVVCNKVLEASGTANVEKHLKSKIHESAYTRVAFMKEESDVGRGHRGGSKGVDADTITMAVLEEGMAAKSVTRPTSIFRQEVLGIVGATLSDQSFREKAEAQTWRRFEGLRQRLRNAAVSVKVDSTPKHGKSMLAVIVSGIHAEPNGPLEYFDCCIALRRMRGGHGETQYGEVFKEIFIAVGLSTTPGLGGLIINGAADSGPGGKGALVDMLGDAHFFPDAAHLVSRQICISLSRSPGLSDLIKDLNSRIKSVRNSYTQSEALENEGVKVRLPPLFEQRWGTVFIAMDTVIKYQKELKNLKVIGDADVGTAKAVHESIKPCFDALKLLQLTGPGDCFVVPFVLVNMYGKLSANLAKFSSEGRTQAKDLTACLIAQAQRRFFLGSTRPETSEDDDVVKYVEWKDDRTVKYNIFDNDYVAASLVINPCVVPVLVKLGLVTAFDAEELRQRAAKCAWKVCKLVSPDAFVDKDGGGGAGGSAQGEETVFDFVMQDSDKQVRGEEQFATLLQQYAQDARSVAAFRSMNDAFKQGAFNRELMDKMMVSMVQTTESPAYAPLRPFIIALLGVGLKTTSVESLFSRLEYLTGGRRNRTGDMMSLAYLMAHTVPRKWMTPVEREEDEDKQEQAVARRRLMWESFTAGKGYKRQVDESEQEAATSGEGADKDDVQILTSEALTAPIVDLASVDEDVVEPAPPIVAPEPTPPPAPVRVDAPRPLPGARRSARQAGWKASTLVALMGIVPRSRKRKVREGDEERKKENEDDAADRVEAGLNEPAPDNADLSASEDGEE